MGKISNDFGINSKQEGNPLVISMGAFVLGAMANAIVPCSGFVYLSYTLGCISLIAHCFGDNEWKNIFMACGLHKKVNDIEKVPKLQKKTITPNGYMLKFTVVEGISLTDMVNEQEAIEQYIGKKIEISYKDKSFYIEVFDSEIKTEYPFALPEFDKLKGITFPIGYSRDGLEMLEISEDYPHLLCAGASGGGKSVLLRSVITSIILLNDKYDSKVKLHLCDMKHGAEFSVFRKCKYVASFSRTESECVSTLENLNKEINRRYEIFEKDGVVCLSEYNKIHKNNKLEYELLIIDEFASLMYDKDVKQLLIHMAQIARAAGVFFILSSQRPDASVIDGKIKCNVSNIVGLRVLNSVNSGIIWDGKGLEQLRGRGHALIRTGSGKEVEIQGMYLSTDKAKELIKHTYIETKKKVTKGRPATQEDFNNTHDKIKVKGNTTSFNVLEVLDGEKKN